MGNIIPFQSRRRFATESLEERIRRLEAELIEALSEKWPRGAEIVRVPYGNHALFFMERDPEAKEVS